MTIENCKFNENSALTGLGDDINAVNSIESLNIISTSYTSLSDKNYFNIDSVSNINIRNSIFNLTKNFKNEEITSLSGLIISDYK